MKNLFNTKSSFATALSRCGRVLSLIAIGLMLSISSYGAFYFWGVNSNSPSSSTFTTTGDEMDQEGSPVVYTYEIDFDNSSNVNYCFFVSTAQGTDYTTAKNSEVTFGTVTSGDYYLQRGSYGGITLYNFYNPDKNNVIVKYYTGTNTIAVESNEVVHVNTAATVRVGAAPSVTSEGATVNAFIAKPGCKDGSYATVQAVVAYYALTTPTTSTTTKVTVSGLSINELDVSQNVVIPAASLNALGAGTHTVHVKFVAKNNNETDATKWSALSDEICFEWTGCTPLTKDDYTLGTHTFTYDGSAKPVTLTRKDDGVPTATIKYEGETTAPTNAGTYALSFDAAASGSYCAATDVSLEENLVILAATPVIGNFDVSELNFTYDKTAKSVTVTEKSGISGMGTVSAVYYEGVSPTEYTKCTTAPTNAGSYTVTFDVAEGTNYAAVSGLTAGTLVIAKADQATAVVVSDLTGTCDAGTYTLSATGGDGDGTYSFAMGSTAGTGTATIEDDKLIVTVAGTVYVKAMRNESSNYKASSYGAEKELTIIARPTITASAGATICGTGKAQLTATASAGDVEWYANAESGERLDTGSPWETPSISETTTYYVGANNNGCLSASRTAVTATVKIVPSASDYTLGTHTFTYDGTAKEVTLTPKDGVPTATIKYEGETIAPTNAGTYALSFDAAASGSYCAATDVSLGENLVINRANQEALVFTMEASYCTSDNISFNATGGSGTGAYSYSIDDDGTTGEGTIEGNALLVTAPGTFKIAADKAADDNYNAATTVYSSFNVAGDKLTLSGDNMAYQYRPITLTLTGTGTLGSVNWSVEKNVSSTWTTVTDNTAYVITTSTEGVVTFKAATGQYRVTGSTTSSSCTSSGIKEITISDDIEDCN